jgi:hypothetical protein
MSLKVIGRMIIKTFVVIIISSNSISLLLTRAARETVTCLTLTRIECTPADHLPIYVSLSRRERVTMRTMRDGKSRSGIPESMPSQKRGKKSSGTADTVTIRRVEIVQSIKFERCNKIRREERHRINRYPIVHKSDYKGGGRQQISAGPAVKNNTLTFMLQMSSARLEVPCYQWHIGH